MFLFGFFLFSVSFSCPRELFLCSPTESHLVWLLGSQCYTLKQACCTVHISHSAGPAPVSDGLQRHLCYPLLKCVLGHKLLNASVHYFLEKSLSPNFGEKEYSRGYKQASLAFENSLRSTVCLDLLGNSIQACQSVSQGQFFYVLYIPLAFGEKKLLYCRNLRVRLFVHPFVI